LARQEAAPHARPRRPRQSSLQPDRKTDTEGSQPLDTAAPDIPESTAPTSDTDPAVEARLRPEAGACAPPLGCRGKHRPGTSGTEDVPKA
jgi:hypothetical protein